MTTIDPPKKLQPLNDTHVSSTVTTTVFQTSPTSETIIALKTAATKTTTNSKTTTTETTDKNKRAGGRIAAQVNIRGHRRKENFKDELTKTIPELPSTTQSTVLRYMISPMPYDVTYTNTGISEKPIEHTLMELGDKIQRILPPVHPAVKGFRRSVDDAGYGLTDKNVILLKVVCDEDEPRIEIKLATNGYSKQPKSSKIKLSKKTEIEKLKYYVQFHNKSVLDDLLVEPSYSSNDIDYYYQASKMSASIFKENGYVRNEATIKINGSPLNELHKSLLTTDSDASTISYSLPTYTTQHKSNIDSTGLVNNVTMLANEETDAIETVNTKDFYTHHNNLTQNGNISEITTPPEVLNVDKFLQNVDSYRKIYSQSFYQRDKSDLARGVSQVTSDFLLHFLPLVVPHALPRSANLMSFSNGSNNDDFKTNKGENKKILKSSPILGKIMTDLNINVKTRLLHSDHELNNNNTINHHKISNITDESDITGDFENTTVDSTTTIDGFKMIFLRKDLRETLVRSSTPNMTIVKVTPIETNVNKPKTWSFSNNNEIKYNLTPTTSTFRVKKEGKGAIKSGVCRSAAAVAQL
ncbi:uncharacterized protein LOC113231899 [Hyposmocoma kahamanoa]|uniref:uncharacterized protein LOC113231899 n=1 Tax=Hyposmocoma kahamanoa TaxID=1477025 RepID=UPI000E6D98A1|nr:uncharacterized protein LOC113231899 [Hyposmocoma kahamanoa]